MRWIPTNSTCSSRPIMTAYGLAFISILWSRLEFVASTPDLRNVHHMVIIVLCALPLVLALPQKVRIGMQLRDRGGIPNWPPYYAPALNSKITGLKGWVTEKQVVFSDQPWAVAWYADRMSIWLPPTREGFSKLETVASDLQTPVAGILISPSSHGSGPVAEVADRYKDFTALVLDGRVLLATYPPGFTTLRQEPENPGNHQTLPLPAAAGRHGYGLLQRTCHPRQGPGRHPNNPMARRKSTADEDTPAPSFEEALAGLETIVEAMEHEQLPLGGTRGLLRKRLRSC